MIVIDEIDTDDFRVELGPCVAVINPAGIWHMADVDEPTCL
jgi:hypothetical protein